jgi:hypothetical protein
MKPLLLGAIAMSSLVAGLFFLSFWRSTKDRFFLFFAVAFCLEAASRVLLGLAELSESVPALYLIRLLAYGCILYAIVDKNRAQRAP